MPDPINVPRSIRDLRFDRFVIPSLWQQLLDPPPIAGALSSRRFEGIWGNNRGIEEREEEEEEEGE